MSDLLTKIQDLETFSGELLEARESFNTAAIRLEYAARRLAGELRQAASCQQITGQRRYTEAEAAEALRVSIDTLRRVRTRQQRRNPSLWPCYTLEGVSGYFYTDFHLGEICSRRYLEQERGRKSHKFSVVV